MEWLDRIVVVGTTGSGKTTLARALAERLGYDHVELDALNWGPNWTAAPDDVFCERVRTAAERPRWVADGNYSRARPELWSRADTIIWLDYAMPVIMWRLLGRTLRRIFGRQELWSGNRERFVTQFFTRDSLLLWALRTYRRRRREYPKLFAQPEYAHLTVVRLRSPRETKRWLATVTAGGASGGGRVASGGAGVADSVAASGTSDAASAAGVASAAGPSRGDAGR